MADIGALRLDSYDLTNEEDVKRLAEELGRSWTEGAVPFAAIVAEEHRGLYWGHMFAAPMGAMGRSIGYENAEAVILRILRVMKAMQAKRTGPTH